MCFLPQTSLYNFIPISICLICLFSSKDTAKTFCTLMLLCGWWTQEFMTLESTRYALCICVICFYASGYKENFPAGTIKMNWNWEDQSAETSSSSGEQGLGCLLKVPGGVFTVNKQLSTALPTEPSGRTKTPNILRAKTFAKPLLWCLSVLNPALLTLACSYVLISFPIVGSLSSRCITSYITH